MAVLQRTFGSKERPGWFDGSIRTVIDGATALLAATGPRELEQLTTELIGTELYQALHGRGEGLRFDWWFTELADATRSQLAAMVGNDEWRPLHWLLHGLAAIAPGHLAPALPTRGFVKSLRADPAPPAWLFEATRVATTGEIWWMRDAYGTRYAVIAGFEYRRDTDRHVLLLDIDASALIQLSGVDVFDDVEQAATAWRDAVGDSATTTQPHRVTNPDQLQCLVHLDPTGEFDVRGDESRQVMDNWFRSDRRIREIHEYLRKAGTPLPHATNLFRDFDVTAMTGPFTEWCAAAGTKKPTDEARDAIADQWMEATLPETWFSVSPRRVEYQLALTGDWIPDEVTTEVIDLLPVWAGWLADRAGLSEHLRARVIAAASP